MSRVAAIVLAAGASSRMAALGRPKALLPIAALQQSEDREPPTFAEAIARAARAAGVTDLVFVLGPPHGDLIRPHLSMPCTFAWNPDPSRGMLSSIHAGLAALQHEDWEPPAFGGSPHPALSQGERVLAALTRGERVLAALVWPVDLPLVRAETVRAIVEAEAGRIVIPTHAGRGGHPVRIPSDLFGEVLALPHERGLRGLMQDHAARVLRLPVDDAGVTRDVDTPDDYRAIER